jgi:NAD(P)H-dependent flavin oxidoreductase YrpB (nitropropane dioxygenase family)
MIPEARSFEVRSLARDDRERKPMAERSAPSLPGAANGEGLPLLLGGGMAVGISTPTLVKAFSTYEIPCLGRGLCLGITSGTAAANLLARRLQHGDTRVRLALDALAALAPSLDSELDALHTAYFIPGGKAASQPYKPVRAFGLDAPRWLQLLTVAGNFTTVWECKQGHDKPVGINYLQKIELSQLPALYGAMLAGVDYVCVGAGNPAAFPGYLRGLARREPVEQAVHVARATKPHTIRFDPQGFGGNELPELGEPRFIAIVSTCEQAEQLAGSEATRPFGFVFEGPSAGGHNAPPADYRRILGEPPKWGAKDELDLRRLAELREPFWLAGAYGNPEGLRRALEVGAAGVQCGTILALSNESGMSPALRLRVLERIWHKDLAVVTEPLMSPTGFPFKVVQLTGSLSEEAVRSSRERVACCDLGHLVTPVETKRRVTRPDGGIEEVVDVQTLCPAEPVEAFTRKGGVMMRRKGTICLCNGLMSTAGYPGIRGGYVEPPVVTAGDASVKDVRDLQVQVRRLTYSVAEAITRVLRGLEGAVGGSSRLLERRSQAARGAAHEQPAHSRK